MEDEREMTEQEELDLRNELAAEVFQTGDPAPEQIAEPEPENVDPWAGVSPALKETLMGVTRRLEDLNVINERLKQAERRVGGLNNRIAELTAKPVEKPPTPEEIAKQLEDEERLNEFLKDFPVHADGIQALIRKNLQGGNSGLPGEVISQIRTTLETDFNEKLTQAQRTFELKLLKARYKNHVEIAKSEDFQQWLGAQDQTMRDKANGWDALDGIEVLDTYFADRKARDARPDITGERNKRLESAAADTRVAKASPPRQKTEAEMTDDELREYYAKDIWRT